MNPASERQIGVVPGAPPLRSPWAGRNSRAGREIGHPAGASSQTTGRGEKGRKSVALVDRTTERTAVEEILHRAASGGSGALLLRGEPGVGKTTLLEHARGQADGFRVLAARGVESEADLPFAGLYPLLNGLVGEHPEYLPHPEARTLGAALGLRGARLARPLRRSRHHAVLARPGDRRSPRPGRGRRPPVARPSLDRGAPLRRPAPGVRRRGPALRRPAGGGAPRVRRGPGPDRGPRTRAQRCPGPSVPAPRILPSFAGRRASVELTSGQCPRPARARRRSHAPAARGPGGDRGAAAGRAATRASRSREALALPDGSRRALVVAAASETSQFSS